MLYKHIKHNTISYNSLCSHTAKYLQQCIRYMNTCSINNNNNKQQTTTTANTTTTKPKRQTYNWLNYVSTLQQRTNKSLPNKVRIVEVGPRDGLQNEKQLVSTIHKVELINRLINSGLQYIETTSFVSPKWVPQMGDANDVLQQLGKHNNVTYAVLTPNVRGLQDALKTNKVNEIAIFAAASESFSQANINCSISESIDRFKPMIDIAKQYNIPIRGYVSCVLGCPYDGITEHNDVEYVTKKLLELGCYEVSLGDTIGIGNAMTTDKLLNYLIHHSNISTKQLAVHFHDTYAQALNNIYISLQYGISVIDSSVSGLGGCPYSPNATGNVATEDVIYMLNSLGVQTGIKLDKLIDTSIWISNILNRQTSSKVTTALQNRVLQQ